MTCGYAQFADRKACRSGISDSAANIDLPVIYAKFLVRQKNTIDESGKAA